METEAPPKKSRKKYFIGIIISAVITSFFVIGNYVTQTPINIELVSDDWEYVSEDQMRITVTLKNTGPRECCVEVKFKTKWNGNSDTATKECDIPSGESRTVSAILDANPEYGGETEYSITWREA